VHFDSSVAGIYWTLSQGGTLVLPAEGEQADPAALAALIQRQQVSHLLALPSLYAHLLEQDAGLLQSLRCVIVAGEVCPPALVALHFHTLPQASLSNEYGPTEATVWCSLHHCETGDGSDAAGPVPIGRPAPGCRLRLSDEAGHPLPAGVPGELWIGGDGVSNGYLQPANPASRNQSDSQPDSRPSATNAARFVTVAPAGADATDGAARAASGDRQRYYRSGDLVMWRPDGELLWLGRLDRQLKLRGHRIEAAEVEQALMALPQVAAAAVDLRTPPMDIDTLAGALTALPVEQIEALLRPFEVGQAGGETAWRV